MTTCLHCAEDTPRPEVGLLCLRCSAPLVACVRCVAALTARVRNAIRTATEECIGLAKGDLEAVHRC